MNFGIGYFSSAFFSNSVFGAAGLGAGSAGFGVGVEATGLGVVGALGVLTGAEVVFGGAGAGLDGVAVASSFFKYLSRWPWV